MHLNNFAKYGFSTLSNCWSILHSFFVIYGIIIPQQTVWMIKTRRQYSAYTASLKATSKSSEWNV